MEAKRTIVSPFGKLSFLNTNIFYKILRKQCCGTEFTASGSGSKIPSQSGGFGSGFRVVMIKNLK
jgi:hypothetical protein